MAVIVIFISVSSNRCCASRLGLQNTPTASLLRGKTLPINVLWPSRLGLQNISTTSLQRSKTLPTGVLWPSRLGLQNTLTASLQRGKDSLTSVLDMTLINLTVSLQYCWSFGECIVLFYCHRSQVHSGPEW